MFKMCRVGGRGMEKLRHGRAHARTGARTEDRRIACLIELTVIPERANAKCDLVLDRRARLQRSRDPIPLGPRRVRGAARRVFARETRGTKVRRSYGDVGHGGAECAVGSP